MSLESRRTFLTQLSALLAVPMGSDVKVEHPQDRGAQPDVELMPTMPCSVCSRCTMRFCRHYRGASTPADFHGTCVVFTDISSREIG
jgi:hypothetical protein